MKLKAVREKRTAKKSGVCDLRTEKGVEREREEGTKMAVSIPILAVIISLHLIAFVFAVGAERRRSTVKFLLYQGSPPAFLGFLAAIVVACLVS